MTIITIKATAHRVPRINLLLTAEHAINLHCAESGCYLGYHPHGDCHTCTLNNFINYLKLDHIRLTKPEIRNYNDYGTVFPKIFSPTSYDIVDVDPTLPI